MRKRELIGTESGVATVEFAITASFFFMMLIAVVAGGHLFWTHNALVESDSERRTLCS
jgi:Flp pilus assembly protein TadG